MATERLHVSSGEQGGGAGPGPPDEVAVLRSLVEGTARSTGDDFFRRLVRHLADAMGASRAFIAEFLQPATARTLAYWSHGEIVANVEYALAGTPCERVLSGGLCHLPSGVQREFPGEAGIESYLGVPLKAQDGSVLGHLCVLDERPMPSPPRNLIVFEIFAARATAELERLRVERNLHESEERLRDLFDEAPIAYVQEGLDTKFVRANRTAQRILGITPEQVPGMVGATFIPDTPEARKRLDDALASINRGTDTSGVVLELRRRDNGKPIFIEWWSRPESNGQYTRTMFIDITERVMLERAQAELQAQNRYLQEELKSVHNFEELVGASSSLVKVLENVRRVAPTDTTVLIWGETGTGKELIARAIHSASQRCARPFIKVNCAALPAGLVESELFGHERGAFSGAIQKRIGRFELANGGTIFLDEIGEMPLDVQAKLLRVLQEQEFERVGSSHSIRTDVRVIAATNRDLRKAMREGTFRPDLYYRLNVFPVELPALRERGGDIPLLVTYFIQKYGPKVGRRIDAVDPDTMQRLLHYPWPGNIRELENIVERALILSTTPVLRVEPEILGGLAVTAVGADEMTVRTPAGVTPADTPAERVAPVPAAGPDARLETLQREHILRTLQAANWVIEGQRGAASRLGLKPATLRFRMKKLGISRDTAMS
jgi:PAS domain S-box-containing protein